MVHILQISQTCLKRLNSTELLLQGRRLISMHIAYYLCMKDICLTRIGRDTMLPYTIHGFTVAFCAWIYRRLFAIPQF